MWNESTQKGKFFFLAGLRLVWVLAPKSQPVLCSYKSAIFANVLTSYQHDLNFFQLSVLTFWARNWQWHHSPSDPKRSHLRVGFVYHNSPSRAHLLAIKTKLLGSSVSSLLEAEEKGSKKKQSNQRNILQQQSATRFIHPAFHSYSVACVNVYDILTLQNSDNF